MEKQFRTAIALMNQAGYGELSARLENAIDALNAETYKIAVVGEFKAGKSSLINSVFLKHDVLFTDIMEATAVPTEICHGKDKRLDVIPYMTSTCTEAHPFDQTSSCEFEMNKGEGEPLSIADPTREDIRSRTSADTPEKRAELAKKISRVKLSWPANNLIGLSIFDTPGINSVNEAVIATTYRIIPQADLVLFVTTAKQLSSIEIEFLSTRVFSQGITRAMTIVTCDPDAEILSDLRKEQLSRSIQSQLANIGREHVPVEMVRIRDCSCIGTSPVSFKDRVNSGPHDSFDSSDLKKGDPVIADVISDLLGERPGTDARHRLATDSLDALEETLIQFIRENVRPARAEKGAQILKTQIRLGLVQCATELSAMDKSENERGQMLAEISVRETRIRREHEALSDAFHHELKVIQSQFTRDVMTGLDRIATSYMSGFDGCEGLGELQGRLNHAQIILSADLEEMFLLCSQEAREKIRDMIRTYGIKSQILLNPWHAEISQELAIDGGILARIPPFAVLALDVLLFARFGPFGPLADVLIRFAANYVPYINKVLPVAIAGSVLKSSIRQSLTLQFERMKADLPPRIEAVFRATRDPLMSEWKAYADEQFDSVRKTMEKTVGQPADPQRRSLLIQIRAKLELILAEL